MVIFSLPALLFALGVGVICLGYYRDCFERRLYPWESWYFANGLCTVALGLYVN